MVQKFKLSGNGQRFVRAGAAVVAVGLLAFFGHAVTRAGVALNPDGTLSVRADVCKLDVCDPAVPSDWYNYSVDNAGDGKTLVAKPGDVLTIMTGAQVTNTDQYVHPRFRFIFDDETNLENIAFYGAGHDSLDGDNLRFLDNNGTIKMSSSETLGASDGLQTGSITAKIADNTPDGTIITGTFYVDNPDYQIMNTFNPFSSTAFAADTYTRSKVRILVSIPVDPVAPVVPGDDTGTAIQVTKPVLPRTGIPAGGK